MGKLTGKTAIVTGASSGIGRATAYKLAEEGANVVVTARREERLKEVVAECERLGGKAVYFVGDASQEEAAIACVNMAIEHYGKIDISSSTMWASVNSNRLPNPPLRTTIKS